MDIAREREARELVGIVAAGIVQNREDKTIGGDILDALLLPYVSGVTDYDLVNDAYVRTRVEAEEPQE